MDIFGLGKKKKNTPYQFKVGETVTYTGSIKKYQGKSMKIVGRETSDGHNHYEVMIGKSNMNFSEGVLMRLLELGKVRQSYTIQQVDEIAKQIQHDSGVKKRVTVKHYNISHKEAKKMAFEKVKTMSKKVILKSVK